MIGEVLVGHGKHCPSPVPEVTILTKVNGVLMDVISILLMRMEMLDG